jgi:hypothetical protein
VKTRLKVYGEGHWACKGVTLALSGVSMAVPWNSFNEEKLVFQVGGQPENLLPNLCKGRLRIFLLITLQYSRQKN